MKPEAFPAKTAAFVPYVKEDFFVKDKKNTPQVLARRALLVLLDAAIVAFSFYFALLLRADGAVEAAWWPHNRELLYENLPWIVAVYIASFLFSGLYSVLWKYAGERDLMRLAGTVAVPTVVVYCVNRLCIHGVLFNSANCMAAVLIFLLVGVAHIVDLHVVGSGSALRGAVVCFYLSNEGVSMLENAAHLGLPVPEKLKVILEQLHDREAPGDPTDNNTNDGQ